MYATSSGAGAAVVAEIWTLPPLILHPFAAEDSAENLLEGSKAALMLHGVLPSSAADREALHETIVRTRVQEVRMLYFLGKDLLRWTDQCADFVQRTQELKNKGIRPQSFAALIVEHTPASVVRKLRIWGVTDHKSVFSRSIGITAALNSPPSSEILSAVFLEHYHRFLDYLYVCYQNLEPFTEIDSAMFHMEMYASSEYTEKLAEEWGQSADQ